MSLLKKWTLHGYQPLQVKKILVPTRGGIQMETIQMACEIAKFHKAKVTALHVLEIPASLPLDIASPHRMAIAEAVLKRAEAIAREFGVEIELEIDRSRSLADTILEVASLGKYDLIVLGSLKSVGESKRKTIGSIVEKIVHKAPCRVWVCASKS